MHNLKLLYELSVKTGAKIGDQIIKKQTTDDPVGENGYPLAITLFSWYFAQKRMLK